MAFLLKFRLALGLLHCVSETRPFLKKSRSLSSQTESDDDDTKAKLYTITREHLYTVTQYYYYPLTGSCGKSEKVTCGGNANTTSIYYYFVLG